MSRQGPPVGLIIAVVAVTAAALLLWMIIKSGDEDASASPPRSAEAAAAPQGPPARQGADRPGLPQVTPSEQVRRRGGDAPPPTETIINGVRVRDHRRDRTQPIEIAPRTRPAYARKIPPELTADISNRILPIVRECASNVPREARGVKPSVQGQLVIAIKDHRVQIRQATIEIADVVGAALEPTQQCIQQKALGVTAPAADEADLEDYALRLSYTLP